MVADCAEDVRRGMYPVPADHVACDVVESRKAMYSQAAACTAGDDFLEIHSALPPGSTPPVGVACTVGRGATPSFTFGYWLRSCWMVPRAADVSTVIAYLPDPTPSRLSYASAPATELVLAAPACTIWLRSPNTWVPMELSNTALVARADRPLPLSTNSSLAVASCVSRYQGSSFRPRPPCPARLSVVASVTSWTWWTGAGPGSAPPSGTRACCSTGPGPRQRTAWPPGPCPRSSTRVPGAAGRLPSSRNPSCSSGPAGSTVCRSPPECRCPATAPRPGAGRWSARPGTSARCRRSWSGPPDSRAPSTASY